MPNTPTPQQIADEMTRLLVDDDTSDLDAVKAQAIMNLQNGDETMNDNDNKMDEQIWTTPNLRRLIADAPALAAKLAAAEKRIAELEAGVQEIDETLRGELPITRIVKDIARRLLDGVK
jgi:hypothetical protein